jgi:hypothetical protein
MFQPQRGQRTVFFESVIQITKPKKEQTHSPTKKTRYSLYENRLKCPVTIEAAKRITINNDPISHRWRRIRRALGAGASKVIVM